MKSLLAIFAHPDDEAFGLGGTLAKAAAQGADVQLICATRGEAGKIMHPDIAPDSNVAEVREQELNDACQALGIKPPLFLDYQDSGRQDRVQTDNPKALMNIDEMDLEQSLIPYIERLQPQILLTFDPHGVYGHIDHLKIHRAATAAFWSAGNYVPHAPKRLYYTAVSTEWFSTMQAERPTSPLAQLDPKRYGRDEMSFAARVDISHYSAQKLTCIKAHRSQTGPLSSFADIERQEQMFKEETFTLGGLRGGFPATVVSDLWQGL
jgi:N-acetyl-1-D-myo-inositol-2-amino-2-deoxy-alpha-D-glucopyranoside deacetylase